LELLKIPRRARAVHDTTAAGETMTTMRDQQNGKTNKAIPLILENEGRYEVSEEATKLLDDLPAPLAVVSIAGLWRTGKSYLLNQLSGATCDNDKTGFQVGASVNACTKGLWLWGEPVRLPDGLTVLFIDTEGLGSTSRTQTEDSQIFSLALLLSSLFVWNSRGVIDGNALEDFALVVNLTKHIHVRSEAAKKALEAHDAKTSEKHFVHSGGGLSAGASAGAGSAGHELDELAQHFPVLIPASCGLRRGAVVGRRRGERDQRGAAMASRRRRRESAGGELGDAAAARDVNRAGLPLGRPRLHP
jgi:hypothetical protein